MNQQKPDDHMRTNRYANRAALRTCKQTPRKPRKFSVWSDFQILQSQRLQPSCSKHRALRRLIAWILTRYLQPLHIPAYSLVLVEQNLNVLINARARAHGTLLCPIGEPTSAHSKCLGDNYNSAGLFHIRMFISAAAFLQTWKYPRVFSLCKRLISA